MPGFLLYKNSETVFQIQLKKATEVDAVYPYVCPFLDEASYACTIYENRPFDCQTWPYIIHKVTQTGHTLVAHFTGDVCLALKEISTEDFEEYKAYFEALVTSEKYKAILKRSPELIWEHQDEGDYHTVEITDITTLLSE